MSEHTAPQALSPSEIELIRFANWIISRNGVIECRLFKDGQAYSGYFNDFQKLFYAIRPLSSGSRKKIPYGDYPRDTEANNVYFTLNPVPENFLGRANNRIIRAAKNSTTADSDISGYRLLMVDADPVRQPVDISSTDDEKAAAYQVILQVRDWLTTHGVTPIIADSGNGWHALIPVNYPDKTTTQPKLIKLIAYLSAKFSTAQVKIDTTVCNPARICKLYGTMARKGDALPTRPHRRSSITITKEMPQDVDVFALTDAEVGYSLPTVSTVEPVPSTEAVEFGDLFVSDTPSVTAPIPTVVDDSAPSPKKHAEHIELLRTVLTASGLAFREKEKPRDGQPRYVFEFEQCPVHTDNDGDSYECSVMVEASGAFSAKCQHNSEKTWAHFKAAIRFDELRPPTPESDIELFVSDLPGSTTKAGSTTTKTKAKKEKKVRVKAESQMTEERAEELLAEMKVTPVGYFKNNLMFFCADSKQFMEMSSDNIHIPMLCSDWEYWEAYCPEAFCYDEKTKETHLKRDGLTLIKESLILGVKLTERRLDHVEIRESGVYRDAGRTIANLGNRIFVDGVEKEYYKIVGDYLYQASNKVPISTEESTIEEFVHMTDILRKTTIECPLDSWILPCIVFSGYLSGLSPWRSHAWVTGPAGSGKTDFRDLILKPLIAPIGAISKDSVVTDASMRQAIQKRCTIFLHDEAESNIHIENELSSIRVSSHGGFISKGTPSGRLIEFKMMCTFILMSISDSLLKDADKCRFININLRHRQTTATEWSSLRSEIEEFFTEEQAARFCRRMIMRANDYTELFHRIRSFFSKYLGGSKDTNSTISRYADLYSGPMAAFFIMTHDSLDDVMDVDIAHIIDSLKKRGKLTEMFVETSDSGGEMCDSMFQQFLDTQLKVQDPQDGRQVTQTIRQVLNNNNDTSKTCLHQYGIYWIDSENKIKLKNNNVYLLSIFKEFGFMNYKKMLRGIKGAELPQIPRWFGSEQMKGLEIPYNPKAAPEPASPGTPGPSIITPSLTHYEKEKEVATIPIAVGTNDSKGITYAYIDIDELLR